MALPPVAGVNCAGPPVIAGLVLSVLVPSVASVAVTVKLPLVPKETTKLCVPEIRPALSGNSALESLEVMATVSEAVLTTFQLASTPFTVTLIPLLAVWELGVPLLPPALPGAAVSPGTNNCNFANSPGLTVLFALVLAVRTPPGSVAVIVRVPAVLKVKLDKMRVPETKVMLPGVAPLSSAMVALLSELVMVTLVVAVVITFQLASTAFTMMPLVMAVPAV